MFEIKNVSKQFGAEYALRDITLQIGSGLNFIIGPSGSGKTTLLKIISGMEQDFEGEALYCGQSIKTLSGREKSYYYNHIFGFIWQDFNLLEDLTVLENVMLPGHLKQAQDKKEVMKVLRLLKISELAGQKAGKLSGGQKQRVAIARELIKNPQVIIADEPTSALDEASAKMIMNILRDISKKRTVIVVTHDTALIDKNAKVYELDKGELIAAAAPAQKSSPKPEIKKPHALTIGSAGKIALQNTKSKWGRFAATVLSLLVAATLLLVTVSGSIGGSGQAAFDKLFETYGESILDISVVGSFIGGAGTDGSKKDEPNADVTQNIDGLYERYKADSRVQHIVFIQAFNDIRITVDHKEYTVKSSGSVPAINRLTAGKMPTGDGCEVVVPDSFVKALGLTDEEVLGKTLDFDAAVYNWDSGEPVLVPVRITVKVVGVADSTVKYESGGKIEEYTVDDAFFFSKPALDTMRVQGKIEKSASNFTIRTKSPAEMIAIKDELNAEGIVPLGRFELVEDMVRLNRQTTRQSGSAVVIIGLLSVVIALAVSTMTVFTRKREYAIYMVSGYNRGHLLLMTVLEYCLASLASGVLFLCLSPLANLATKAFWEVNILSTEPLLAGVLLVLLMGALSCMVTGIVSSTVKASASLKTGDR